MLIALGISILAGAISMENVLAKEESVPLRDNLGKHHYRISTKIPQAQRYFDQGLIWSFGFNHAEAARSFREAARLDPQCAMCYWGEALVLGPNINAPMDEAAIPQAYKAVQNALALTDRATEKERVLIQALAARYAEAPVKERDHLDTAYADAMRGGYKKYPDDPVIGALLAEALMDLHPWDFWTKQGEAQPWTQEIVQILEDTLGKDVASPLANHLYIHVIEASPHPEKALCSAERLAELVPGSGHLAHMPGHIYIRIGRYRDAALANQRAVKADRHYLHHSPTESIYTAAYVPHNYHFLWAAATKTGQQLLAMQAAQDAAAQVDLEAMRDPGFAGTLQHFWLIPLYTKALFGQWQEILREPAPPPDLVYPAGIWHYARGLAFLRQGNLDQSGQELVELQRISKDPSMAKLSIFDLNAVSQILKIAAEVLAGEIAAVSGQYSLAVEHLRKAIEIEDGLNYTEPKDWYLPPRQVLGAVLVKANRFAEAEQIYREDLQHHPHNGWSLFGLAQSLKDQGKIEESKTVQQQFEDAWSDADVTLQSSRF